MQQTPSDGPSEGPQGGHTPTFSCAKRAFDDFDEQAAYAADGYDQRYLQVSSGKFKGQITAVDLDGVLVYRESLNRRIIQSGTARGLSLIWTCGPGGGLRCNGVELGPNYAAILEANSEFEVISEPTELVAISITPCAVEELFAQELEDGCDPRGGVRVVPPQLSSQLSMSIIAVLSQIGTNQELVDDVAWCTLARARLQDVIKTMAGLPSVRPRGTREVRFGQIVRRSREQLDRRTAEAIRIDDLCRKVGVSRRNLHYAFMSELDTPPMRFLKALRMGDVRRAIRAAEAAGQSIGDIAAQFGFLHPSHFAADYVRHFGELPSITARLAQDKSAFPG